MELKLEIWNRPEEYEPARDRLLDLFRAAGLEDETVDDLELVLEELLVNIISYAYDAEGTGKIVVSASVDDGTITLEFRDSGRPFNPLERESPDVDAPFDERPVGGLGIFLVTQLATTVDYRRLAEQNVLTVTRAP
jgi:sigma-B regulation protein RsbU (phosphoserine phosphatase)